MEQVRIPPGVQIDSMQYVAIRTTIHSTRHGEVPSVERFELHKKWERSKQSRATPISDFVIRQNPKRLFNFVVRERKSFVRADENTGATEGVDPSNER